MYSVTGSQQPVLFTASPKPMASKQQLHFIQVRIGLTKLIEYKITGPVLILLISSAKRGDYKN
jgi:hypothetical protein